jgi:hypothetical protein
MPIRRMVTARKCRYRAGHYEFFSCRGPTRLSCGNNRNSQVAQDHSQFFQLSAFTAAIQTLEGDKAATGSETCRES